jgi:hypothetical protein
MQFDLQGQSDSIEAGLISFFASFKSKDEHTSILQKLGLGHRPQILLPYLRKYENALGCDKRNVVVQAYYEIAKKSDSILIRQQMISNMLRACEDSMYYYCCNNADWRFKEFNVRDFDDSARQSIARNIYSMHPSLNLVLIAGMLELDKLTPRIKNLIKTEFSHFPDSWYAHSALARMGDIQEIEYCIAQVDHLKTDAEKLRACKRYLLYIKHPKVIDYIVRFLYSEQTMPSSSRYLVPVKVASFAIEVLSEGLTDSYILKREKNKLTDYDQQIKEAQQWYERNNGNYKINRDVFR